MKNFFLEKLSSGSRKQFVAMYNEFLKDVVLIKDEKKRTAGNFIACASRNRNYNVFLLKKGNRHVGFFCFVANHRKKGTAYLHGLFVLKEHRKKGIAEFMARKEMEMIKKLGMKRIVFRTWSSNTPVIRLHEKHGFHVYRRARSDRADGSDTLWFEKKLE